MATSERPILIIPGILGSVLVRSDTGDEIWPRVRFPVPWPRPDIDALRDLKLPVHAADVVREISFNHVYSTLFHLFDPQKFPEGGRNYANREARLFVFPYDWRRDLREAAFYLAKALRTLQESHSGLAPDLICHSMGGLVVRYCLQGGDFFNEAISVHRVIFIGAPHRGAPKALLAIDEQVGYPGLHKAVVREISRQQGMAGVRQLFPQPGEPMVLADESSRFDVLDLYASHVWSNMLNLDVDMVSEVAAFADGLGRRALEVNGVLCLVGTSHPTPTHVFVRQYSCPVGERLRPICPPFSGDGTVPTVSAYLESFPYRCVAREHAKLFQDPAAREAIVSMIDPNPAKPFRNWEQTSDLALLAKFLENPEFEKGIPPPALDIVLEDSYVLMGRPVRGFVAPSPVELEKGSEARNHILSLAVYRLKSDEGGKITGWQEVYKRKLEGTKSFPRPPRAVRGHPVLARPFFVPFEISSDVFREEGDYEILVAVEHPATRREGHLWARERVLLYRG